MRILFRADSFPCFYSSVFVRFGASGFPFRFRYVFSRISPGPPPASLPSSFGSAFPVSGFRLRLVLSRIIRLHVWRYVSRRGLRGTTIPTAQAVPVAHAAASADRAEPENRPERPLPSGPKLRAAAASVLPSGGGYRSSFSRPEHPFAGCGRNGGGSPAWCGFNGSRLFRKFFYALKIACPGKLPNDGRNEKGCPGSVRQPRFPRPELAGRATRLADRTVSGW